MPEQVIEFSSFSNFKVLECKDYGLIQLNKEGFNNEPHIGIFHIIGKTPDNKYYLLAKPKYDFDAPEKPVFATPLADLQKFTTVLLSFYINNN